MINEIAKLENLGKILSIKEEFIEFKKIDKDREQNYQENEIKKINHYKDIAIKLLDTLNILIKEDSELIQSLVIVNQKTIDQLKEIANNDELSEEKINETLSKIFETTDTINKVISDYNNRKNRNNITGNALMVMGVVTGCVIVLSKEAIKISEQTKNMRTISYKIGKSLNNIIKIG